MKCRQPISKPSTTPNAKPKQAHAKAMTTPRNRKLNSNTNGFLSVKNPKTVLTEVSKTTVVAKALVFQSPKRDTKKKISVEVNTPVKTLCAAMKKLEITSVKKNVLGDGQSLAQDVSRKKVRGREVKSRVFDSLGTHSCKRKDAKSARVLKRRSKEKNLKPPLPDHATEKIVGEDASDMDIDEKSRHISMQGCSLSSSAEGNQDELSRSEYTDNFSNGSNETSLSNSGERISEKSDFEVVCEVEDDKYQEENHEEMIKTGALEKNISELLVSDDKENVAETNKGNQDKTDLEIVEPFKNSKDDETSISNPEEKNSETGDLKLILCEVDAENGQECNLEERTKSGEIPINISELESGDKENVASINKENAVISDDVIEHESETDENVAPNDNR